MSAMEKKVKTSVIIALFNTEKYIDEAIQSLINQTIKIDQIIVVNDGSTDHGPEIIKKINQIEIYHKENSGLKDTLNFGLSKTKGEFIGFLDADDRWVDNKLEIQLNLLEQNHEIDVVYGISKNFKYNSETQSEETVELIKGKSFPTGLYRKSIFEKVGLLTTDSKMHNFIEWYDRATSHMIKDLVHNDIIYERRIHDSNIGVVEKQRQRNQYLATLKASLDRRRAANNLGNEPE